MTLNHFPLKYVNGELHLEDVPVKKLAREYGTPLYAYSRKSILDSIKSYRTEDPAQKQLICFAMKSNSNQEILKIMAGEGLGTDIVSGGELFRARKAGIPAERIVFSGVGKTDSEIVSALEEGILLFSVESEEELINLNRLCEQKQKKARVSIRVNPDVDADTHPYISTGLRENKFGIMHEEILRLYGEALQMKGLEPAGIGFHIGSQLTALPGFRDAGKIIAGLAEEVTKMGVNLRYIDVGGGLGITYKNETPPEPADYVREIYRALGRSDVTVIFEPGRRIVGNAGILITEILYKKSNGAKTFFICDAAMNDLMRPSLYSAYHEVFPENETLPAVSGADLVGPVCETGDFLAKDRTLPDFKKGDLAVLASAGAYGFSMSSNYNSRPRSAEVLIEGASHRLIRKRETYEDLILHEMI